MEKVFLLYMLERNHWNISRTAEIMGIQRSHLHGKIKKFQIVIPRIK
ncbi:MAG: helix-turn-helix domain-containing protein [Chitinophagaceae bacterium]